MTQWAIYSTWIQILRNENPTKARLRSRGPYKWPKEWREYLAWCIYWWPTKMRPCLKPGGKWRPHQRLVSDPYTRAMHVSAHIHICQHEHTHTHTIFKSASLDELFLFWMHLQITGEKIKLSSVLKNLRATEYTAFSLHWFRVPHFCVCSVKTDTCLATVH